LDYASRSCINKANITWIETKGKKVLSFFFIFLFIFFPQNTFFLFLYLFFISRDITKTQPSSLIKETTGLKASLYWKNKRREKGGLC